MATFIPTPAASAYAACGLALSVPGVKMILIDGAGPDGLNQQNVGHSDYAGASEWLLWPGHQMLLRFALLVAFLILFALPVATAWMWLNSDSTWHRFLLLVDPQPNRTKVPMTRATAATPPGLLGMLLRMAYKASV